LHAPRRAHVRFGLRSNEVVAVAILGFAFLIIDLHPMYYSDIWGHLKYGQWIVEHKWLPDREPFTPFSDQRQPFVNFYWLSQLLFYLVYHAGERAAGGDAIRRTEGGVEFLRALHAAVAVGQFLVLLAAFRLRSGSRAIACAGLAVCVILSSQGHLSVLRPQILGELGLATRSMWWNRSGRPRSDTRK